MSDYCLNCGVKIYGHKLKKYCSKCKPLFLKSEVISISLTSNEKIKIEEYGKKNDMTPAEVVRFFLEEDGLI
jgi:hypothetical protein